MSMWAWVTSGVVAFVLIVVLFLLYTKRLDKDFEDDEHRGGWGV